MKLKKPCVHDLYDGHYIGPPTGWPSDWCSGGEFLADDAPIAQALGELLVATGLIRDVPLTGPELLAFSSQLTEDLRSGVVALTVRSGAG